MITRRSLLRASATVPAAHLLFGAACKTVRPTEHGHDEHPDSPTTGTMAHELPPLPYSLDALEPHITAKTLGFHHGKHHAGYVKKLNDALAGSIMSTVSLEDVVRDTAGKPEHTGLFNNAAQAWNHAFN